MSLDLPAHGDPDGWDVKLNAALQQLDSQDTTIAANLAAEITRATTAEAANAAAITAEATARATAITNAISALVNGAPGALDTLNELATALAADESAAATLSALVGTKAPLASPAFTGTPTVPTAAPGTNTTQAASTAFTTAAVAAEATARAAAVSALSGTYAKRRTRNFEFPQAPRSRKVAEVGPVVYWSATLPAGLATATAFGEVNIGTGPSPFYTLCSGRKWISAYGGVSPSHISPNDGRDPGSVIHGYDGVLYAVKVTSAPGHTYRVMVDDEYIGSPDAIAGPGGGAVGYIVVDFTALGAKPRNLRIDGTNCDWMGLYKSPTESFWALTPRGPSMLVLTDSYGGGASAETALGYSGISSWVFYMAHRLGLDDVINGGLGGSGYGAGTSLLSRLTSDVTSLTPAPDIILWALGHNDQPRTVAQIEADALACMQAADTAYPDALHLVMGPFYKGHSTDSTVFTNSTWSPVQTAIFAAAAQISGDVRTIDTVAAQLFTGTGNVGALTGSGNSDIYIQGPLDNTHPDEAGAKYQGDRAADLVLATLGAAA